MALTADEQREMYADIKVIKSNCVRCMECQKDHEKRIKNLEQGYWGLLGGSAAVMWIIEHFLR